MFRKALEFYLSRLPEDMIPCWDMLFAPESGEPLGFLLRCHRGLWIAGSGKVCGRNRSCPVAHTGTADAGQPCRKLCGKAWYPRLRPAAARHLQQKEPYNTCTPEGVDECTSWGDYFYMEALTRLTKDWEMYW